MAFFARWWQLERYIRTLVYLELRSARGKKWVDALQPRHLSRASRDSAVEYMASPEADDPLAYVDLMDLFAIIDEADNWPLFETSLLPRVRWQGVADELRDLRNRNAHARRPHKRDLERLERVLTDLEPGAARAFEPYGDTESVPKTSTDVLVAAWMGGSHPESHLIAHGRGQYRTNFSLRFSRRPWASATSEAGIEGVPGYLWHARWFSREGDYSAEEFWRDDVLDEPGVREHIVHVLQGAPYSLSVTFSAVDDQLAVADALASCYDAALDAWAPRVDDGDRANPWPWMYGALGSRLQIATPLSMADQCATGMIFNVDP